MQSQKHQLREAIRTRILSMRANDRAAESRSVSRRIIESLPSDIHVLCAYAPLKIEVNILPVLKHTLEQGSELYLPRAEGGGNVFRKVEDLSDLSVGHYNTLEPSSHADKLPDDASFIALVPGIAFDRSGGRLGRGNGAFDHWIADMRKQTSESRFWGICFECQIVQEVPTEAHDERVDAVVTVRGISQC